MATVRELVTVLRYKLDKSGLSDYRKKGVRASQDIERGTKRVTTAQRQLNTAAGTYNATMKRAVGVARTLLGAYLGIAGARGVLKAVDDARQLAAQLKRTGISATELVKVNAELFRISQSVSKETIGLTRDYIHLRDALSETGISTKDQLALFDALQQGLSASGASASKAAQFMRRFSRNVAEGALSSSTIQTMLDANQVGLAALVKGLQKTHPELNATMSNIRDLATQGKLTSDVVLPALNMQLEDLRKTAGDIPDTLSDATQRFRNSFREVVSGSSAAEHGLDGIIKALDFVGDNASTIIKLATGFVAAWGFSKLIGGLGAVLSAIKAIRAGIITATIAEYAFLLPWILIGAAAAAIVLIIEDIYEWLTGGESLIGDWVGSFDDVKDKVLELVEAVKGKFTGAWNDSVKAIKDVFTGIFNWMQQKIDAIIGVIRKPLDWISSSGNAVSNAASAAGGFISDSASGLWDSIKSPFTSSSTTNTDNRQTTVTNNINVNAAGDGRDIAQQTSRALGPLMPTAEAAP